MASEVLKVSHTAGVTNAESVLLNGVSGHTYTILSISICETAGAAETVDLYLDDGGGGTDYEILSDQAVGANETFIFNDKIVVEDDDILKIESSAATSIAAYVSVVDAISPAP